jgi:hypothetical protein
MLFFLLLIIALSLTANGWHVPSSLGKIAKVRSLKNELRMAVVDMPPEGSAEEKKRPFISVQEYFTPLSIDRTNLMVVLIGQVSLLIKNVKMVIECRCKL